MLKAGDLLKRARLKNKFTYTLISSKLKIPVNTIKSLEKNQYKKLPSYTYIIGFIKNYANFLKLDQDKIIAIFKRDYQKNTEKIIPKGLTKPLNSPWLSNPNIKAIITTVLLIFLFFIYLGFSFYKLQAPPKLIITQPKTGQELTPPVLIKGKTNHDATLTLNGKIINLEQDGTFTTVFNGPSGAHELKFISTSRRQKSTQKSLYIILN